MDDRQPDLFTLTRTTDPITSREAAADVLDKISEIQRGILLWAKLRGKSGFTDRDLVNDVRYIGPSTLRTRRSELVAKGLIRHKHIDGTPQYLTYKGSKRRHIVWEAVP